MDVGFSFPTPIELKMYDRAFVNPEALAAVAQAGEDLGFDEITVFDHFLEPPSWQPSDLGIHAASLASYLDLQRRIGEQVLPEFRP